jgi:hypothetical protein
MSNADYDRYRDGGDPEFLRRFLENGHITQDQLRAKMRANEASNSSMLGQHDRYHSTRCGCPFEEQDSYNNLGDDSDRGAKIDLRGGEVYDKSGRYLGRKGSFGEYQGTREIVRCASEAMILTASSVGPLVYIECEVPGLHHSIHKGTYKTRRATWTQDAAFFLADNTANLVGVTATKIQDTIRRRKEAETMRREQDDEIQRKAKYAAMQSKWEADTRRRATEHRLAERKRANATGFNSMPVTRPTSEIQRFLVNNGYVSPQHLGSNYDWATTEAVRGYQRSVGVTPDGIWGHATDAKAFPPSPPLTKNASITLHSQILPGGSRVFVTESGVRYEHSTRRRPLVLTREEYRKRHGEMRYAVRPANIWGFEVLVSLAIGKDWVYWRPTRSWAESTGTRMLRKQLHRLDSMLERAAPTEVKAKDIGVLYQMTTDELTAELNKADEKKRDDEMTKWDQAFNARNGSKS